MVSIAVAVSYSGRGTCGIGIHSSEYGGISILCKQSDEIRLNDSISAVCAIYTASPNTTLTIYGRTSFPPLIHDLERSSPFMDTCVDNKIFNCALRRVKEFGLILEKDRVIGAESVYRLNSARNCARDATKYSLEDVSSSRILFSINEDIVAYVVRSSSEFSNSIYNDNALDCSSTYTVNRKAEFQQSSSTSLALLPKAYASMDLVPDSVVIFVLCMGCTELICIACPRYHNMSQKCFEAEEVDSTIVSTLCRSCSRLQATKTSTVLRRAENGDRYNRDSSICIECFVMNPNYGRVYNVLYEQRKIESHNRVKYIPIDELLDKSDAKCNLFGVVFDEAQPVIQMKNRAAMGFL